VALLRFQNEQSHKKEMLRACHLRLALQMLPQPEARTPAILSELIRLTRGDLQAELLVFHLPERSEESPICLICCT
jgi:hypothetical protein